MEVLSSTLRSAAYLTQQRSLFYAAVLAQRTARALIGQKVKVDREHEAALTRRYQDLLRRDLHNVENGMYPASLLRFPALTHAKSLPLLLADVPRTLRRIEAKNYNDLPVAADPNRYPAYYRRNFHWQTDGYFSKRSAEIYDVGVEFLFGGTADVMRRQIIPPITRFVRAGGMKRGRLLDIACGTGRVLRQIAITHPTLRYYGNDISPYYVKQARELLHNVEDLSLVVENAENLPFSDQHFDVVTCVYLFHELPKDARRAIMAEAFRVLRPGGIFVVQDSAQSAESSQLANYMFGFAKQFHEPYYRGYLDDDLSQALTESGFVVKEMEPHFVAKVVVARRPE